MQSGEVRKEVIDMLGGSVLGTPWATGADEIIMHIGVNFSPGNPCFFPRKRGVRVEPELTKDDLWLSNAAGDWDEELSEELSKEGRLVLKEMVLAPDIAIPRSFRPSGDKEGLELGGFWHGGDPASSGCVYSCHENTKQDWILEQIHEVRLMYYDNEVKRTYWLCFFAGGDSLSQRHCAGCEGGVLAEEAVWTRQVQGCSSRRDDCGCPAAGVAGQERGREAAR